MIIYFSIFLDRKVKYQSKLLDDCMIKRDKKKCSENYKQLYKHKRSYSYPFL